MMGDTEITRKGKGIREIRVFGVGDQGVTLCPMRCALSVFLFKR